MMGSLDNIWKHQNYLKPFNFQAKEFVLEADNECEKLQWMVLMHYAKRDQEKNEMAPNAANQNGGPSNIADINTGSTLRHKDDPVLEYARRATEQSNIAVNRLYQFYENEKMRKVTGTHLWIIFKLIILWQLCKWVPFHCICFALLICTKKTVTMTAL